MVTIRRYIDLSQAELDKSLLEAEGIRAFIPDESSVSTMGFATALGGVRLQVADEDRERAQQLLGEEQQATPLPDDFVPPTEEPPPAEPPKPPKPDDGSANAFLWGGTASLAILAVATLILIVIGGSVFLTLGGVVFLFFAGGVIGLVVHANFPKHPNGGS